MEVGSLGHTRQGQTPAQDHDACKLANWQLDQGERDRQLKDQLSEVHNASQPGELVPFQPSIIYEAEYRSVG